MEQCLASDKEMTEKSRGDADLSNILLGLLILNIENKLCPYSMQGWEMTI